MESYSETKLPCASVHVERSSRQDPLEPELWKTFQNKGFSILQDSKKGNILF